MVSWTEIAALARHAPTPHNTQPFRIRPLGPDSAELVLCCERLLSAEDHGNAYMMSAFGIFMAVLERAGRRLGRVVRCTPRHEFEPSTLQVEGRRVVLGTVILGESCARETGPELLELRRTSRLAYEDRVVPEPLIRRVSECVVPYGQSLIVESDPRRVRETLELNADALLDNLRIDAEREEIRRWYRYGATPEVGDGLWQGPMNQPAWELKAAFASPWLFALPGFRQFARNRFLKTQAGTRHVALLCGAFRGWEPLLSAGRALAELWFEMAAHDLYLQPFGSMLTNPAYARRVAERFETRDCWLIFRFGYSAVPPRAPRLESILIHE